ncbi:hypothetical protein [Frankia sp. AgB32]|uniref:hypothetical protein n=1 Tax=Frankia sp. AgB32 TaxID=631119 RepID=UPI002010B7BC|nr:hypothetical protein [Frankia sp. AgB32]MCK9893770.1 hypothetical protein [Frankia sp. AgB32]
MGAPTDLPGSELPLEAPDADAAEQAREVRPPQQVAPAVPAAPTVEVDEFDLVEQSIIVETDEDDYR